MRASKFFAAVLAATVLGFSFHTVSAQSVDDDAPVKVQLDNDLFSGHHRDRDYTGGVSATMSGSEARDSLISVDPLLARVDHLAKIDAGEVHFARQFGLLTFTPADLESSEALTKERPYANLLYVSNARMHVDEDQRTAVFSSLTVGVMGLGVSRELQSAVHKAVGGEHPEGYDHQISAGGEPTGRYMVARQYLWVAHPSGRLDVKTTVSGSVGYLTETSVAISARIGRLDSAWWSFAPELTDYMAAPVAKDGRKHNELYVFSGIRLKARAYNAFLQGQFRDSDVRYSYDEISHFLINAWIGVATQLPNRTELTYTLNYQSSELREGDAVRDSLWGAIELSHSF
jgi:hypothetical protein